MTTDRKRATGGFHEIGDPSSPAFRLASSPFYLMAHADFKYHEDMDEVLARHGVSRSIYRIMTVLRETTASSITQLSEAALIKRSTVSRIVERMAEAGLATTSPAAEDNRITEVTLTEKGRALLDTLTPVVGRQFQRATQGIARKDLDHLVRTLQAMGRNLSKLAIE